MKYKLWERYLLLLLCPRQCEIHTRYVPGPIVNCCVINIVVGFGGRGMFITGDIVIVVLIFVVKEYIRIILEVSKYVMSC